MALLSALGGRARLTPVPGSPCSARPHPLRSHAPCSALHFSAYIRALAFSAVLQRTMHIQQACRAYVGPSGWPSLFNAEAESKVPSKVPSFLHRYLQPFLETP